MSQHENNRLDQLAATLDQAEKLEEELRTELEQKKQNHIQLGQELAAHQSINNELLQQFLEGNPYIILPKAKNESWIITPRYRQFQIGWLERQNEFFNVFIVNKFVDWITDLPDEIRDQVGIEKEFEKARVEDGEIEFADEDERDRAWNELGGQDGGLYSSKDDNRIKIKNGSEFDVLAELIDRGNLPFTPQPVQDEDLRGETGNVELRPYQERAWNKFVDTGMIGVYWSPGAGKTFLSLYAGERVKGDKLVIVPSSTLREQWEERIQKFCEYPEEWEVQTYQYITQYHLDEYQRKEFALTVFDESHHLPANSFSKLATLNTKYRIGLSASPYREDGRTEYIFALTGYPVGLKWRELIELGAVQEPDVSVYRYSTKTRKRNDLENVVGELTGKILVFCDGIQEGKRLSKQLGVPFVHGETQDRMEKFENNRVVIGSRVADEGLSLSGLDAVVEYDFHGGSRRQEAQRAGRVMHGESQGRHIVMMTDDELSKFERRLYSLEEQGFDLRFERRK